MDQITNDVRCPYSCAARGIVWLSGGLPVCLFICLSVCLCKLGHGPICLSCTYHFQVYVQAVPSPPPDRCNFYLQFLHVTKLEILFAGSGGPFQQILTFHLQTCRTRKRVKTNSKRTELGVMIQIIHDRSAVLVGEAISFLLPCFRIHVTPTLRLSP